MTTATKTVEITTQPTAKKFQPRVVEVEKGRRLNRHYNDDGSITLYSAGVKLVRLGGEDEDADEAAEKYARRWFGSGKPVVWGNSTYGHNWKNKKAAATAD